MDRRQFLQGPTESDSAFAKRIRLTKEAAQNPQMLGLQDVQVGKFHLPWLLYKISNKKLPPWEAAATWVIEYQGVQIPFLQVRERYAENEEVWNHELVHIMRIAFNEPRFEEIIAFDQSKSRFRKWLGPLFRTPKESLLFLAVVVLSSIAGIFYPLAFLLPVALFFTFIIRLFRDLRTFSRCKKVNSLEDILRMSDEEILRK
ncbi:MAG: hypothetical protein ChlgKO_05500 [Chlamydiales bacterium]